MKYLALYFLFGAIVAVWTAINAQRANLASMLPAYALVALVWPLSLAVFVLSLVAGLSGRSDREGKERGR